MIIAIVMSPEDLAYSIQSRVQLILLIIKRLMSL